MYPPLIRQHLEVKNDTVLFLPFIILQIELGIYYQKIRLMLKDVRTKRNR